MKDGLFHFKRFSVAHSQSSMKVGVDAVLIGAWADCSGTRILDVGTGCGVIALMMAQRNQEAGILGIDVDAASVEEARVNIANSPWRDRVAVAEESFSTLVARRQSQFDLIISNPPYFDSGVKDFTTSRNVARHQGELSPHVLLSGSTQLLSDGGRLAMIVPSEFSERLRCEGADLGLPVSRSCFVKTTSRKPAKRVMMEFSFHGGGMVPQDDTVTMFDAEGRPSAGYVALCRDFYLKF